MLFDSKFCSHLFPSSVSGRCVPSVSSEPRDPRSIRFIIFLTSSLLDPIRQSVILLSISLFGYRSGLCHSRVILTALQTFRAFSNVLSSIAAISTPGSPCVHLPVSSTRIIAIAIHSIWLGNSNKRYFGVYSVRSRYSPTGCLPSYRRLLLPSFQLFRSPQTTVGYNYAATLGITAVGLSPTRTLDSLATRA